MLLHARGGSSETATPGLRMAYGDGGIIVASLVKCRFINFYEVLKVNSAVIYVVGFLVLLATVQLWNLLHHNHGLHVIGRSLSRAWDEVAGFLLVILILLTGYAIAVRLHPQGTVLSATS